jgi:hypothetical protein
MNALRIAACLAVASWMLMAQPAAANLLRNGSFEQTPCTTPCNQDQAYMPSEWLSLNVTPDTYSNDGSYGVAPDAWGNFIGVTAQDGIRWVAAWSIASEILGQTLTSPLVPGASYTLRAYLRPSVRADLANPGTYQAELWDSTSTGSNKIILGSFDPTAASQGAWELRTLTFTAPAQAATYPVLAFRPVSTASGDVYPGLDNVCMLPTGSTASCVVTPPPPPPPTTVVIDGCDSGVPNVAVSGNTVAGLLSACAASPGNHGQYVSCIASVTNGLVSSGILTGRQKGKIQSCAARARIP